jgi:hypothetical protein
MWEKKPMVVGTNLFLWGQIYGWRNKMIGCGNKSMVRTNVCGNKIIWLWEQRHIVVGTKENGCRNKRKWL